MAGTGKVQPSEQKAKGFKECNNESSSFSLLNLMSVGSVWSKRQGATGALLIRESQRLAGSPCTHTRTEGKFPRPRAAEAGWHHRDTCSSSPPFKAIRAAAEAFTRALRASLFPSQPLKPQPRPLPRRAPGLPFPAASVRGPARGEGLPRPARTGAPEARGPLWRQERGCSGPR